MISDNVKLIPGSQIGPLEFIEKEFIWRNGAADQFNVKMSQIETILIDKLGSTVLFTLKQGMASKMVHFLKAEDLDCFEIVLMEFIGDNRDGFEEISNTGGLIQITSKRDSGDLDEATVNLLEAFSKIPLLARDILGKIKGDPQNLRRPRGLGKTRIPLNPWIIDKPLNLPPSRIKECGMSFKSVRESSLSIGNQATMIYNSGGKLIDGNSEMRFKLWSAVLKSDYEPGCADDHVMQDQDQECYNRIEKDLNRLGERDALIIDRLERILIKYCGEDPEIGYVQGMSDLALPFARFSDEEASYEMFKGLMKRIRFNFMETSSAEGIEGQLLSLRNLIDSSNPLLGDYLKFNQDSDNLFFTYRWLLVLFRREFSGNEADRLWDVMMAAEGCGVARIEEYRVFVALAMILGRKDEFMATCSRFEDLLKVRTGWAALLINTIILPV